MTYPDLPGVPVEFGALALDPVPILPDPAGDIVLRVFGDFLYAVMLYRLSAAWLPVSGASTGTVPVVKTVQFNNPNDNTLNDTDLPCLYLYRDKSDHGKAERVADDLWEDTRWVVAHWIPDTVDQELQALRSPFFDAVRKTIKNAILQERHVAWKQSGETDQYSLLKGTCITRVAGLWEPPLVESIEENILSYPVEGEAEAPKYPGLVAKIRVAEGSIRDMTGYPLAQNDGVIRSGDNSEIVSVFSQYVPPT